MEDEVDSVNDSKSSQKMKHLIDHIQRKRMNRSQRSPAKSQSSPFSSTLTPITIQKDFSRLFESDLPPYAMNSAENYIDNEIMEPVPSQMAYSELGSDEQSESADDEKSANIVLMVAQNENIMLKEKLRLFEKDIANLNRKIEQMSGQVNDAVIVKKAASYWVLPCRILSFLNKIHAAKMRSAFQKVQRHAWSTAMFRKSSKITKLGIIVLVNLIKKNHIAVKQLAFVSILKRHFMFDHYRKDMTRKVMNRHVISKAFSVLKKQFQWKLSWPLKLRKMIKIWENHLLNCYLSQWRRNASCLHLLLWKSLLISREYRLRRYSLKLGFQSIKIFSSNSGLASQTKWNKYHGVRRLYLLLKRTMKHSGFHQWKRIVQETNSWATICRRLSMIRRKYLTFLMHLRYDDWKLRTIRLNWQQRQKKQQFLLRSWISWKNVKVLEKEYFVTQRQRIFCDLLNHMSHKFRLLSLYRGILMWKNAIELLDYESQLNTSQIEYSKNQEVSSLHVVNLSRQNHKLRLKLKEFNTALERKSMEHQRLHEQVHTIQANRLYQLTEILPRRHSVRRSFGHWIQVTTWKRYQISNHAKLNRCLNILRKEWRRYYFAQWRHRFIWWERRHHAVTKLCDKFWKGRIRSCIRQWKEGGQQLEIGRRFRQRRKSVLCQMIADISRGWLRHSFQRWTRNIAKRYRWKVFWNLRRTMLFHQPMRLAFMKWCSITQYQQQTMDCVPKYAIVVLRRVFRQWISHVSLYGSSDGVMLSYFRRRILRLKMKSLWKHLCDYVYLQRRHRNILKRYESLFIRCKYRSTWNVLCHNLRLTLPSLLQDRCNMVSTMNQLLDKHTKLLQHHRRLVNRDKVLARRFFCQWNQRLCWKHWIKYHKIMKCQLTLQRKVRLQCVRMIWHRLSRQFHIRQHQCTVWNHIGSLMEMKMRRFAFRTWKAYSLFWNRRAKKLLNVWKHACQRTRKKAMGQTLWKWKSICHTLTMEEWIQRLRRSIILTKRFQEWKDRTYSKGLLKILYDQRRLFAVRKSLSLYFSKFREFVVLRQRLRNQWNHAFLLLTRNRKQSQLLALRHSWSQLMSIHRHCHRQLVLKRLFRRYYLTPCYRNSFLQWRRSIEFCHIMQRVNVNYQKQQRLRLSCWWQRRALASKHLVFSKWLSVMHNNKGKRTSSLARMMHWMSTRYRDFLRRKLHYWRNQSIKMALQSYQDQSLSHSYQQWFQSFCCQTLPQIVVNHSQLWKILAGEDTLTTTTIATTTATATATATTTATTPATSTPVDSQSGITFSPLMLCLKHILSSLEKSSLFCNFEMEFHFYSLNWQDWNELFFQLPSSWHSMAVDPQLSHTPRHLPPGIYFHNLTSEMHSSGDHHPNGNGWIQESMPIMGWPQEYVTSEACSIPDRQSIRTGHVVEMIGFPILLPRQLKLWIQCTRKQREFHSIFPKSHKLETRCSGVPKPASSCPIHPISTVTNAELLDEKSQWLQLLTLYDMWSHDLFASKNENLASYSSEVVEIFSWFPLLVELLKDRIEVLSSVISRPSLSPINTSNDAILNHPSLSKEDLRRCCLKLRSQLNEIRGDYGLCCAYADMQDAILTRRRKYAYFRLWVEQTLRNRSYRALKRNKVLERSLQDLQGEFSVIEQSHHSIQQAYHSQQQKIDDFLEFQSWIQQTCSSWSTKISSASSTQ